MRASRLLSILILLQLRGRLTSQALSEAFEVSPRTIYRDIEHLSAAGVPVYADRGPGGGFALLDGYRTRLTGLSADEAETLLLQGLAGPAAALGLGQPLATARLKLLAAAPEGKADDAMRIAGRFHLDPVPWHRRAETPGELPRIGRAVWEARRIAIAYGDDAGERRTIDPLGLVLKAGAWYLVGRSRGRLRTYKVDRIARLEVLEDRFTHPAGFDLAGHWQAELARFEAGLQRGQATVRLSPAAMARVYLLGAEAADAALAAVPDETGWRQASMPIEDIDEACAMLLGFGAAVEVMSPPALRRRLAEKAAAIAALYREAGQSPR
ncbi:putative DNA-binding transcriptional regulator YafY [Stella humosa]|uniref:Putative DNA-binding transcriptional regulator YafY n=1 Tax=Stella humosa TaxID=94 RepID=A0A3N1LIY9_9PROT|nr:WYL domain-containing protein [Stella humosa]ROP91114.1 putative DNA-binding transcriptional regulator YafY [Stella humosa]BBK34534.1 transcriptional regulator [Stella humosa]